MAGARIVLSGHHAFFMMRAMTNTLYSQADSDLRDRASFVSPAVITDEQAKEAIAQQVRCQRDFSGNYFSYTFQTMILPLLCGLSSCLKRSNRCKRRINNYKKLQLVQERLMHEHDIQEIIAMNRVTKLIHKAWFLKRQRRAINFGHKFTISDLDIENAETQASRRSIWKESANEDILSVDRDKILE